jgi:hypothetical protein
MYILYKIFYILYLNYWPFIEIISVNHKISNRCRKKVEYSMEIRTSNTEGEEHMGATSWMWNKREDRNHPISFPILISVSVVTCQYMRSTSVSPNNGVHTLLANHQEMPSMEWWRWWDFVR